MKIYIPTFMREDNQKAYNNLPSDVKCRVTLVTHSGRADILREHNPQANILDLGVTDGIADVRQKIVDQCPESKLMIIDDQCRFKKRNSAMKYEPMDVNDYDNMFNDVEVYLDKYGMVGISDRAGNNRLESDTKEIARMYSVYGINKDIWNANGIRFDGMYQKNKEIRLYEDFYAILSMLTKGLPNLLICNYIFESTHGIKGGNSVIRNNELQKKCIDALQQEFPMFVGKEKKENASWTTDADSSDRWEARISWQDAYKKGMPSSSLSEFF